MTDVRTQIATPTLAVAPRGRTSRADIVGMVLGMAVPAVAVGVGLFVAPPIEMLAIAGVVGIPLGIVLGSIYGVQAREADPATAFDLALRMAALAVVAGDLVIGTFVTIGLSTGGPPWVLIGAFATLAALVLLGLPALAFAIVCTFAWIVLLRLMPDRLVGDGPESPA